MTPSRHVKYKPLTLKPRTVTVYYLIQDYIKRHGKSPTYYEIGMWFGGSRNHWTARNRGIQACTPLLAQGFIVRKGHGRGSQIQLGKPFTQENLLRSPDAESTSS